MACKQHRSEAFDSEGGGHPLEVFRDGLHTGQGQLGAIREHDMLPNISGMTGALAWFFCEVDVYINILCRYSKRKPD